MKKSNEQRFNDMDKRLDRIELLLTNHLKHTEKYIYILSSAIASGTVGYLFHLLK